jgi:hypothetical protein
MGRKRLRRVRRVRAVWPVPDRSDLPPNVSEFMRIFDDSGSGCTVDASEGGTVWTIRDPLGNSVMTFASGPAADQPPQDAGDMCMNLKALWGDPEFRRQLESGLVDLYGRPTHPEGRNFFAEYHQGHDHEH